MTASSSSRTARAALAILAAGALLLSGCAAPVGPTSTSQTDPATSSPTAPAALSAFESASEQVSRVVVNITTEDAFSTPSGPLMVATGNGSGIVLTPDGYILTNDHVVAGAKGLVAVFGGRHVTAKVVGRDPSTDLAVVKVDLTGLEAARIGDPKALRVGQWVIAVGTPFGLDRTVTTGIISALHRSNLSLNTTSAATYTDLVQTDAAINPGNSGGALATLDGSVVGVNSLAESQSGDSAGIGFAIPIDYAVRIADQLMKTGKAVHPYIGVSVIGVDSHIAAMMGLSVQSGALVQQVAPRSSGAAAGLTGGDVIVSLAGRNVTDAASYFAALTAQRIGSTVAVTVVRGSRRVDLKVRVGSGPLG